MAAKAGGIDVVLNAIGIVHVQGKSFSELALEEFAHPIAAYMRASFLIAKAAARQMVKRGSRVTCGAIETFSRILAGELGPSGVRVVCLRPDVIPESLPISHAREVFAGYAERQGVPIETILAERAKTGTLLGRFPTLAEVGAFAAFVASDRAGAMTGAIVNLTCGSVVD